jgi:hypothetical protein
VLAEESSKSPVSFKLSGPFEKLTVTLPIAVVAAVFLITNSTTSPVAVPVELAPCKPGSITLVYLGKNVKPASPSAETENDFTASLSKSNNEAVGNCATTIVEVTECYLFQKEERHFHYLLQNLI